MYLAILHTPYSKMAADSDLMIWVELQENEASRAKRRCLQMLL